MIKYVEDVYMTEREAGSLLAETAGLAGRMCRTGVVDRMVEEASGLARSMTRYRRHRYPQAVETGEPVFFNMPDSTLETVALEETFDFLETTEQVLERGHDLLGEHPIGMDRYHQWEQLKKQWGENISDYVLVENKEGKTRFYLFDRGIEDDGQIGVIQLERYGEQGQAVSLAGIQIGQTGQSKGYFEKEFDWEAGVLTQMQAIGVDLRQTEWRWLGSGGANGARDHRHCVTEREGDLVRGLRERGVWKVGELGTLQRLLFSSMAWDSRLQEIAPQQGLEQWWLRARAQTLEGSPQERREQAEGELSRFGREAVFYQASLFWLKHHPQVTLDWMGAELFKKRVGEFQNYHLWTRGATGMATAEAMLADGLLRQYQRLVDESEFCPLGEEVGYYEELGAYVRQVPGLEVFAGVWEAGNQREGLVRLVECLNQECPEELPGQVFMQPVNRVEERAEAFLNVEEAWPEIMGQLRRHPVHVEMLQWLEKHMARVKWRMDPHYRQGVLEVVMAHLLMKRDEEGAFLFEAVLDRSGGYAPDAAAPRPELREQTGEVGSMRAVLGELLQVKTMEEFREKVYHYTQGMVKWLSEYEMVPEKVREFFQTLRDPDALAGKVQERLGAVAENDNTYVGRFFVDDFDDFWQASNYRYAFDLVFGFVANAVWEHGSLKDKANHLRRFSLDDVPVDLSERQMHEMLMRTLAQADNRVARLNHEPEMKHAYGSWSAKDWMEQVEIVTGWDMFSTKFLRWKEYWDVWNTLGGVFDCMCFYRIGLFNVGPLGLRTS